MAKDLLRLVTYSFCSHHPKVSANKFASKPVNHRLLTACMWQGVNLFLDNGRFIPINRKMKDAAPRLYQLLNAVASHQTYDLTDATQSGKTRYGTNIPVAYAMFRYLLVHSKDVEPKVYRMKNIQNEIDGMRKKKLKKISEDPATCDVVRGTFIDLKCTMISRISSLTSMSKNDDFLEEHYGRAFKVPGDLEKPGALYPFMWDEACPQVRFASETEDNSWPWMPVDEFLFSFCTGLRSFDTDKELWEGLEKNDKDFKNTDVGSFYLQMELLWKTLESSQVLAGAWGKENGIRVERACAIVGSLVEGTFDSNNVGLKSMVS